MPLDLRERELLAQLVAVAVVRLDVDRAFVEERLVQTVQLLANHLLLALDLEDALLCVGFQFAPRCEDAILHEAHEAWTRLQSCELLNEQIFQLCLGDVDGAAAVPAVVVRVIAAPALRPARRERLATGLAPHVAAQREVRIVALTRGRQLVAAVEDSLNAEKDCFGDQRLEFAALRNPECCDLDLADVHAVPQNCVERL
ncbi:MAG TPA: hypothetical protein VFZ98_11415 [Vicinamibacterales bacterium]